MNFLLKIVEGPNKGAEIALVEGIGVTLGKGDDCDIVLADLTMPDAPLKVEASADGVVVDGEPLEPLSVRTSGATSFAIGPADTPWGELKWPKAKEAEKVDSQTVDGHEVRDERREEDASSRESRSAAEESGSERKKRGGCFGCLTVLLLLLILIAGLAWFFRDSLRGSDGLDRLKEFGRDWYSRISAWSGQSAESSSRSHPIAIDLHAVVAKYGLLLVESNGMRRVSGNLSTRRERLAATAEVYQSAPGAELDLSDDESFRSAAEDALFTITEGTLKVTVATNRVLAIVGTSPSPMMLKKAIEALNVDLPKLRNVDVSGVTIGGISVVKGRETLDERHEDDFSSRVSRPTPRKKTAVSFPVCGILTTPYPCIVMRDGRRLMEGATIGDSIIIEIGSDSVTLTNTTGRFTWKP